MRMRYLEKTKWAAEIDFLVAGESERDEEERRKADEIDYRKIWDER